MPQCPGPPTGRIRLDTPDRPAVFVQCLLGQGPAHPGTAPAAGAGAWCLPQPVVSGPAAGSLQPWSPVDLAASTHLPMRAASSLRASTTDAGSSGWEPLGVGREALSWPALSPATLARPDQAPRPPQAAHLRSRWCAPPRMAMASTDALRLLWICCGRSLCQGHVLTTCSSQQVGCSPRRGLRVASLERKDDRERADARPREGDREPTEGAEAAVPAGPGSRETHPAPRPGVQVSVGEDDVAGSCEV